MTGPQVVFFDAAPEIGNALRRYWVRKEARLERLLKFIPAYKRHVQINSRSEGDDRVVRIMVTMPTSTLVGTGKATDWKVALDMAMDHLAAEIRWHKGILRREHLQRRKRRSEGDTAAIAPELERHARRSDKAAFMEQIKPLLRSLRDHAQRELIIAQLEGHVRPGFLTVSDLLDEVIVRAWKRFRGDLAGRPLDRALMGLLHEILDEHGSSQVSSKSLYEQIDRNDPRYKAKVGWAADEEGLWGEAEPLTLEEVLPSDETMDSSDPMREEEQRRWILVQLGTFQRRQRRAFALYMLEGWDEEAIGALQGRSPSEVRRDIESVRSTLRQRAAALDTESESPRAKATLPGQPQGAKSTS